MHQRCRGRGERQRARGRGARQLSGDDNNEDERSETVARSTFRKYFLKVRRRPPSPAAPIANRRRVAGGCWKEGERITPILAYRANQCITNANRHRRAWTATRARDGWRDDGMSTEESIRVTLPLRYNSGNSKKHRPT